MENKDITITLKVPVWNSIISNLANGKYSDVAMIIAMIQEQAKSQVEVDETAKVVDDQ